MTNQTLNKTKSILSQGSVVRETRVHLEGNSPE